MARVQDNEYTLLSDREIAATGIGTSPAAVAGYADLQRAVYTDQVADTEEALGAAQQADQKADGAQTAADSAQASADASLKIANNLSDLAAPVTARDNLGLGTLAVQDTINNDDWSGADLVVGNGGTGASSAPAARTNLGAAKSGANDDITSLTALTSIDVGGPARVDSLRIDQAATAGTFTATHYLTLSLDGVIYRVPCAI